MGCWSVAGLPQALNSLVPICTPGLECSESEVSWPLVTKHNEHCESRPNTFETDWTLVRRTCCIISILQELDLFISLDMHVSSCLLACPCRLVKKLYSSNKSMSDREQPWDTMLQIEVFTGNAIVNDTTRDILTEHTKYSIARDLVQS